MELSVILIGTALYGIFPQKLTDGVIAGPKNREGRKNKLEIY
jgi:hypothetical protein